MALQNFQNCLHGKYLEISTENDGKCTGKLGLLGQRGQWDRCRKHVQVVWFQRGKLSIIGCFATTITLQYIHMFAANPTAMPTSDPAYPLTCSNPCVGLAFF